MRRTANNLRELCLWETGGYGLLHAFTHCGLPVLAPDVVSARFGQNRMSGNCAIRMR